MHLVYTVLLCVYFLAVLPATAYGIWRRGKEPGSLRERFGRLPAAVNSDRRPSIWVHAVSVGEALAARPLLRALRAAYPEHRLVVSTTTATGQRVARGFGRDADAVCYAPFDFPWFVKRALDRVAPDLLLVVDTEIWPNLLRACRRRGVGSLIVNGRLSDRSFRRYRLVRGCMRRVLADVGRICAQTEEWAQRFVAIGADPARVVVTGSLKFDAVGGPAGSSPDSETGDDLRAAFEFARSRPVLIAASTLRGEEEPVLRAFGCVRQTAPDALLVIAPRHPERFEEARGIAGRAGYRARMRSELGAGSDPGADVVILNTLGELGRLFGIASAVFVGGSLVPAGGHNPIEPAAFGRAIVFGPHMENFADVARELVAHGAAIQVGGADALAETLVGLMQDGDRRSRLGEAARSVVDRNRGATRRTLESVAELLPPEVCRGPCIVANDTSSARATPAVDPDRGGGRGVPNMLSALYARGAAWRRWWYARPGARRRLSRPVVSVGALAAGGSGKTPVAALVAELLRDAGERPAVLSRGYGRRLRASGVVVVRDPDRVRAGIDTAGDEPRMLAERLDGVSVLVSRDRYRAGRMAETRLGATVHVLDDGFQHLPLARDLDLVLLRAEDLGQPTFPAGRLRERPATARMADALVVDAADMDAARAVADRLGARTWFLLRRSLGALCPVASPRAGDGTAAATNAGRGKSSGPSEAAGGIVQAAGPVLAVAGIAAPERFRDALAAAGFEVAGLLAFADHHPFTPADVRRIAAQAAAHGAGLVLTTEKDAVRLAPFAPFDFAAAAAPLRVAVEPADRFRAWLLERIAAAAGDGR